jgi:ectoine hydroxylase
VSATPHATRDRYASRVGGGVEIRERVDPVVWGDEPGPLDATQLASYERDGFVALPGLLDPATVGRCTDELARLAADPAVCASECAILEPDGDELRSLFEVHRSSPVFAALAADPRLAAVARQLLGSDVYIHQSRVNLKPGFAGRSFPWHSDFETWHVEDGMPAPRALSCSVALSDNHSWNGSLLLIAGSHRWYVACAGRTPDAHHLVSLRKQEYGVPDHDSLRWLTEHGEIRDFTGPAGSVLFFDCNTMHGSPGNMTPLDRSNAFIVYNSVDNALVEPFGTERPRPSHIAAREFSPI